MGCSCSSDSSEPAQHQTSHSPSETAPNPIRTLHPAARSLTVSPSSDNDEANFSHEKPTSSSPQTPALPRAARSLADSRDGDPLGRVMSMGGRSEDPAGRSTSTLGKEPPAEGRGAIVSWTNIPEQSVEVVIDGVMSSGEANTNVANVPQPELLSGSSASVATWTESGANSELSQPEVIRDTGSMLSSWFGHMSNGGLPDGNWSSNSGSDGFVDNTSAVDEEVQESPQSSDFSMKGPESA